MRDSDSWFAIDAATGDVKAKIPVAHGKQFDPDNHPIGGIGPHNTWMNPDGTRVYMAVLTMPYIWIADTRTNQVIGKVGPFSKGILDQKEVWVVDGIYGYVYAFDVTSMPPKHMADVPLFKAPSEQPRPGWISFSLDGRYAYPDGGAVIDAYSKKVVARIPTSEKLIEIDFRDGKPVKAGHR